jgi:hypothetical protein
MSLHVPGENNFCCPVKIKNTEATYENGFRILNIPLKDSWKDSFDVVIH